MTTPLPLRALRGGTSMTLVAAMALLLAACANDGPTPTPGNGAAPPTDGATTVTADNMAFDTDRIVVEADDPIVIEFVNDENQPHNISIYTDDSRSEELFQGEIITADSITYEIEGLEPGEYYFDCRVHPEMNGTFVVEG